jgi:hypothetical protein
MGYNEFEVNVKAWDKPTLQGDNEVCLNDTTEYQTYYDDNLLYDWTADKGVIISQDRNKIKVNWNVTGTGEIWLRTENELTHRIDTTRQTVLINPNPPKPAIRHEGKYLVTDEYDSHQWYLNGKKIIGGTRHYYKAEANGKYQVMVIDSNGCKSELSEPYDLVLGIEEYANNNNRIITPNPATDYIVIAIDNHTLQGMVGNTSGTDGTGSPGDIDRTLKDAVKVYDVLGNVVLTLTPALSLKGEGVKIDVSGLAAGVYFVRIGGNMYKFVKM